MKTSTLKALRFPILILLGFGILATAMFVFSNRLPTANGPARSQGVTRLFYPSGPDSVNAKGKHFGIDDLYVEGDKLNLRYHATGVASVGFDAVESNSLYGTQPPTLITVTGGGASFIPVDASISGEQGSPLVRGEYIWRFSGEPPHHLDISVVRLIGDTDATWTVHLDR